MRKYDIILCECNEHQIIVKYDDDDDWESIYISYHLSDVPLGRRIVNGIKYIFGKKSKYGHWGELILEPNDETIRRFENIVSVLKTQQINLKNSKQ